MFLSKVYTVQLTLNLNASKKKSRVSSARHASSRARGLEGSSGLLVRGIERSSARALEREGSRARSRSQARGIGKLAARCYYRSY